MITGGATVGNKFNGFIYYQTFRGKVTLPVMGVVVSLKPKLP